MNDPLVTDLKAYLEGQGFYVDDVALIHIAIFVLKRERKQIEENFSDFQDILDAERKVVKV